MKNRVALALCLIAGGRKLRKLSGVVLDQVIYRIVASAPRASATEPNAY